MRKKNLLAYVALGVIFILFHVIAFVIPSDKTATFWTAYIYTDIAFVFQIGIWTLTLGKKEPLKSKFLGFPIIQIGIVYLIAQLLAFVIFKSLPMCPAWLTVIVCTLIFGIAVLCSFVGQAGIMEIVRIDEKVTEKRFYIQSLQIDVEMIVESENNPDVKKELQKLVKIIRFSEPMSHETLAELEAKISDKIEVLKTADDKMALIKEIEILLTERNKKCKILKESVV